MYHHLSLAERERLYALKEQGKSLRHIAKELRRSQSSLTRELRRNIRYGNEYWGNVYLPCKAQGLADKRGKKQRTKAPLKEPAIFLYVRKHLREPYTWTPEQIAGRLPRVHPGKQISTETIYQYIYGSKGKPYKLWRLLPLARKKRMRKGGRRVHRDGKIPGAVSIDVRSKEVAARQTVGHWETDNLGGKVSDTTAVSTTVERLSRVVLLDKLADRTAPTKAEALTDRLLDFPKTLRQTMTTDNGAENTNHADVTAQTGIDFYFCHAYHSWEKGTVENTNKVIRRYIPKGTSADIVTSEQVKIIEQRLNSTPRKCLGFLTPHERMEQLLHSK